ncbi:MAG: helix-turn-helix domain-containing protein [Pseudomonadota bacterium]
MGTLVNASRESVNKLLKEWEGQGLIERQGARIFLIKPTLLESMTEAPL